MKTIALCGLSFLLTICPLQALYFWDLNGSAAGSGSSQPTGSWNADAYWNEDPQGDGDKGGCVFWPPEGYSAVFAAGDDAYDAYTVYINGIVQASAVHVDLGQVTFDPDAVNGGSLAHTRI